MRKIDRFDIYLKKKGITDNKATIDLGLSIGTLGKSRKENRDLSDRNIELILNYYRDLDRIWLLTGEGSMLREKETSGNHFRGDGNSYINVGSGTLSQNAKETNSEMYVKRIAELEEENKELRHKIDKLTADLLKSKERIIELLERE